jgi:hypothetical protein
MQDRNTGFLVQIEHAHMLHCFEAHNQRDETLDELPVCNNALQRSASVKLGVGIASSQ